MRLLLCALPLLILSCSDDAAKDDRKDSATEEGAIDPAKGIITGTLAIEGTDSALVSGAKIEFQNHPEISGQADENGDFKIANVSFTATEWGRVPYRLSPGVSRNKTNAVLPTYNKPNYRNYRVVGK